MTEQDDTSELRGLLDAIHERHGYDFRDYAKASLARRVAARVAAEGLPSVAALRERVLAEPACLARFLVGLSCHTSSMFRDPGVYLGLRTEVLPLLRTYPFLRFWCAGCSSGEEVYSLAILLGEEDLLERCRIYATDVSEAVLETARRGVYPIASMQEATLNYQQAGGRRAFSEYYTASHDHAVLRPSLRERVVFAEHNLATDASFQECHVILCRNVMIYFNDELAARVHGLLYASLARLGYLGLGSRESIRFSPHEACYEPVSGCDRVYRKVR